jgi:hypothetical protein
VRLPNGTTFALSDDPNVNGQADPNVAGDEDPTRLTVQLPPPAALLKANTRPTASIGEVFTYRITVPSVPDTAPLYNVRILDDLTASAADLSLSALRRSQAHRRGHRSTPARPPRSSLKTQRSASTSRPVSR